MFEIVWMLFAGGLKFGNFHSHRVRVGQKRKIFLDFFLSFFFFFFFLISKIQKKSNEGINWPWQPTTKILKKPSSEFGDIAARTDGRRGILSIS